MRNARCFLCCILSAGFLQLQAERVVKIDGETLEKTTTEITFDNDNVILYYADNTCDSVDMALVEVLFSTVDNLETPEGNNIYTLRTLVDNTLTVEGLSQKETVIIYNIQGRIERSVQAGDKTLTIDVSGLPKGLYFLKAGQKTVKFIKN